MDPGRDAGGVAGTVLIPMRFVWPYGGRSVFLCGSFTRWSELLPMSPVEGCPTVFQVIYNLPPGYHQYKFFVDGEWRHDEHQPYVPGEYGMVNTVFLATDPNYIPVLNSDVAPGNSMDVDNEAFRRVVRLTDGSEVLPRISEADVQISRQRISAFLSSHTAYELLPESGKVVALDVDLPVKQAFHILHEQLGNHGSNLTEEELETHSISAWKEGKSYLNRQNNGHGAVFSRRFIHSGPYDNLKDIAVKILQKEVSTVPVIHCSSEHASFPQLLHLASLSGILKCICRYFRHCSSSLPALQFPICAIPVGTWVPKIGESNRRPLAMLRPTASLASALNLLVQGVRRLVIVEAGSKRVEGIVSLSDIFKFFLGG